MATEFLLTDEPYRITIFRIKYNYICDMYKKFFNSFWSK